MTKKIEKIFTERINKFQERISKQVLLESLHFDATYYISKEQVQFKNRLEGEYVSIKQGDVWGEAWDNAWFHLKGSIPNSWMNKKVVAKLNFTGEGLIFSNSGVPLQGITSSSVFNKEFKRDIFSIIEKCKGGEE